MADSTCTRTLFESGLETVTLAIRNRCPTENSPFALVKVKMFLEHRLRESAKWSPRQGFAGSHSSSHRPSAMDMDGGAYSTLLANYHRSYHPHCKAHYLAGDNVGSHCGRRRTVRSRGPSWHAMASRYFVGRNHRIFCAQRERARSCATQAQPRRSGLSI